MDEQRLAELERLANQATPAAGEVIIVLIAEVRHLQSELANAKTHAEAQQQQAREAVYNEVISLIYNGEFVTTFGLLEHLKGLRDKQQAQAGE